MESRTILKIVVAAGLGGGAMVLWPTYGSCLGQEQTLDLEPYRSVSMGCQAATATYTDWRDKATIAFDCADGSSAEVKLADGWPAGTACGLQLELVDHWQDAKGDEIIRLWVQRP